MIREDTKYCKFCKKFISVVDKTHWFREKNSLGCKEKRKLRNKTWYYSNIEKSKENSKKWHRANKQKANQRSLARYYSNKDEYRIRYKKRYKDKLEEYKKHNKKWRSTHKIPKDVKNAYQQRKYRTDLNYKLRVLLRSRLSKLVTKEYKTGSAVKDLGCSIAEFKLYIEKQFQPGMTWENWGLYTWHLDHIKPLANFDLTDPIQFKQAVHYTNIQPLWALENLQKGAIY